MCNFQTDFSDCWLKNLLWNWLNMNVTGLNWWSVNSGLGNGLVPSGNKPLPEPMLTQISVAIWCHQAAMTMTLPKSVFTMALFWWIFLSCFRWAVSTVMTRQNQIPCDGNPSQSCMALIPLWDMCNHTEGQVSALQNTLTQCSGCHFNR